MSLRNFLREVEKRRRVIHVKEKVSPRYEISSIIKAFDRDNSVLFFDNIDGFKTKIVANVCGIRELLAKLSTSMRRACTTT
ncbi:MAG: UbiD family decarboxylase [Candidatus Bathyarchaeota archaeon]|nr:UbiD family decarboxylase [Candidatus Bathyarchaeota archaeon]